MSALKRTAIYVDSFNLYYGALKDRPHCKWLNLHALCSKLLKPENEITAIRVFTAKVKPRPNDPDQPRRQALWFRATRTIPKATLHFGQYTEHPKRLPAIQPLFDASGKPVRFPEVLKSEEKGSDVNLASWLWEDAYTNSYDVAVVITNDSDLVQPIRSVRRVVGKPVGLICPHAGNRSTELKNEASFHKIIRESDLIDCQFPDELTDSQGTFRRPDSWK